jgi:hypothetical protein
MFLAPARSEFLARPEIPPSPGQLNAKERVTRKNPEGKQVGEQAWRAHGYGKKNIFVEFCRGVC